MLLWFQPLDPAGAFAPLTQAQREDNSTVLISGE
jgi:hypothetical protein